MALKACCLAMADAGITLLTGAISCEARNRSELAPMHSSSKREGQKGPVKSQGK